MRATVLMLSAALLAGAAATSCPGAEARFLRGINLNGPALVIDGRAWEADTNAPAFKAAGKRFANPNVALKPPTDVSRTEMIRSSVWDKAVTLEFGGLEPGDHQVVLYVWEDNHSEQFDLLVNGAVVHPKFHSGTAGMWKRLGPWRAPSMDGKLTIGAKGASHGAANLSGIELWSGDGEVPEPGRAFASEPTAEQVAFFESRIRPVLAEHCYECHSAGAEKLKAGLLLDSRAGVVRGGDSGPVILPGEPDASLLILALRHARGYAEMPPKRRLPPEVVADFEQWVRMGAPDPRTADTVAAVKSRDSVDMEKARDWWSLRPLTAPPVPSVRDTAWPLNDVDRFLLARMEQAGLRPAPDAEPRALIRRITYDLTGLPPTPEEVESFVKECREGSSFVIRHSALAKLVDRLLASPRYGERWGRHWLDVVRYADTAGDNSDYPIPQMHRYRDWVIEAFNRDLPYDEFVRDQLAGDLRGGATEEVRHARIVATGYLANSRRFGSRVDDYPQHLTIEDTLDNLGRSFLGTTLSCARCHDHKFDPVSARDYYALYGIFHSTRYPWPGIELDKKQRDFVPLVPRDKLADAERQRIAREEEQQRLDKKVRRLKDELKTGGTDAKAKLEAELKTAEAAAKRHQETPLPFEFAYAVADAASIEDALLQQKGDPAKPGGRVPRRFLAVLGGHELPEGATTSGRTQLAEWIVAKENPLTARVMANRIWLHHFGRGLVPTPNDFGRQGKPPTHPELLDHLAAAFRDGGWSVKAMHRLILTSRAYRQAAASDQLSEASHQSSVTIEQPAQPASLITAPLITDHFAVHARRRLDAEAIRDTLLALGGNLDLTPPGPHPFPPQHEWGYTQHKPFKDVYESNHRSVYLMTQRIQRHPYLAIFDGADPSTSTPTRTTSTTPLQALWLLNDPFVHDQSRRVADRLLAFGSDETARIRHAYELLFARPPEADELKLAMGFLATARASTGENSSDAPLANAGVEAWAAYVRALFRLNEFVYVD